MPQHLIDLALLRDNASELMVEVCFEYELTPQLSKWQYKRHGRIQLLTIMNKKTGERIIDLSLDEHIQLKGACRQFLESSLLKPGSTIAPFFS